MTDNTFIRELYDEGFNNDTIRVLYLIPVIETAWADGKVHPEERAEILELLKTRGIQEGSEAYKLIEDWLSRKPVDRVFVHANSLIEPLFQELSDRGGNSMWVMEAAMRVARATGDSRNPISLGEMKVLKSILARLDPSNKKINKMLRHQKQNSTTSALETK